MENAVIHAVNGVSRDVAKMTVISLEATARIAIDAMTAVRIAMMVIAV